MTKLKLHIFPLLLFSSLLILAACRHHSSVWPVLSDIEAKMETYPDSALTILKKIAPEELHGKEEQARYALLMSMALDKNYVDTTDFSVLQPAIDYYPAHGTPDEKLKTYLYQGRIHETTGHLDSAMQVYLKGLELRPLVKDTLHLAHLISSYGVIQYSMYAYEDYLRSSLDAMALYRSIGNRDYEILSLAKAIGGSVVIDNRHLADSLMQIAERESDNPSIYSDNLKNAMVYYAVNYQNHQAIHNHLTLFSPSDSMPRERRLDILLGYIEIGDKKNATSYFNSIDTTNLGECRLKYLEIKPDYLKFIGDETGAFTALKDYMHQKTQNIEYLWSQDLMFTKKHHDAEMAKMEEIHRRDRIISISLGFLCALLIILGVLIYILLRNKMKRAESEKENHRLRLENENHLLRSENLQKEKDNLILEKEKQSLTIENQQIKVEKLEAESENRRLKNERLLKEKENLLLENENERLKSEALEKEKENLLLENENQRLRSEALLKEKEKLLLENETQKLNIENQQMKVKGLEAERDNLKDLLRNQETLTHQMKETISQRLELLNAFLASQISGNEQYSSVLDEKCNKLLEDKEKFMTSNKLAVRTSNPAFIEYLEKCGMTPEEINYACLYVIGLTGKEVGSYIQLKRHYHISSDIRRKLGLDPKDTNLGIYLRKLMKDLGT